MSEKDRGAVIVSDTKQLAARSTALATRGMALLQTRTERQALEALYNSTDGPNWVNNTGWLQNPDVATWYGVTCRDGHVVVIDLSPTDISPRGVSGLLSRPNGLRGVLPPELANLTCLEVLRLSSNQLFGPIPPELGNLGNLQRLLLSYNQLSGPIPAQLGNLRSLVQLDLWVNQLNGPIPAELGNLSNLRSLKLRANDLDGPIPSELGNLSKLEELWLSFNHLSGPIPRELGNLRRLQGLWLTSNRLTGPIPRELGNLTELSVLHANANPLSGVIPAELSGLELHSFWYHDTGICERTDPAFQAWLSSIARLRRADRPCRDA